MRTVLFAVVALFVHVSAHARVTYDPNSIVVTFAVCTMNQDSICALVHDDSGAREMTFQTSEEVLSEVRSLMGKNNRSFPVNVTGKIVQVSRLGGGSYSQLVLQGLSRK